MSTRAIVLAVLAAAPLATVARAQDRGQNWGIFLMNRDGSDVRRVVYLESFPTLASPRWSHDGRRLAFEARGKGPARALLVDASGRNLIDLGAGSSPDWSPDDKQVLFEVPTAGRHTVWVQNANGQGSSWLAAGRAPRWSPDGSRIAVGAPLRLFDVVTGRLQNVFTDKDDVHETLGCDWSPDGARLAAIVRRADRRELILIDADREPRVPEVRLRGQLVGTPDWSPDGKQLAVTIHDSNHRALRIHVLAVDGNDPPTPIPGQQGDNRDPAFAPDGRQIAFTSTRSP